jgi:hypothetical protein
MSLNITEKYHKYKLKYLNAKQHGGAGATPEHIMDVIELYNKTLNLYILYRFRYDNTKDLIDLGGLSDKIYKLNESVKNKYNEYYIKNLLTSSPEDLLKFKSEKVDPNKSSRLVFTLRQDTTKIIKNLLLINNESADDIEKYINFLKVNELSDKPVFDEIYQKCIQIKGLVTKGSNTFKKNKENEDLDIIRNNTNQLINIIGDDFDKTLDNLGIKANNIEEKTNELLDRLFKECFKLVSKKLETDFCKFT